MNSAAAIRLHQTTKRYGRREVLHAAELEVQSGECVALIGHNGAGKTTLMKLVLGLTRPTSGTVRVSGLDPSRSAAKVLRKRLGYLPENVAFSGGISGRDTLRFYARLKGVPLRAADDLLEEVGLAEAARRPVRTYSKGMRQRLGLAQAALGSPQLLVLDEPASGLDPTLRGEFYDRLRRLRDNGTTTLIASHSLSEIEGRTDRIAVLKNGSLMVCGSLDQLREQAQAPVHIRVSVRSGSATRVAARLGAGAAISQINEHQLDIDCLVPEKMDLLRRIAAAGDEVRDVEVIAPSLDEIYRHFNREENRQ